MSIVKLTCPSPFASQAKVLDLQLNADAEGRGIHPPPLVHLVAKAASEPWTLTLLEGGTPISPSEIKLGKGGNFAWDEAHIPERGFCLSRFTQAVLLNVLQHCGASYAAREHEATLATRRLFFGLCPEREMVYE